MDVSNNVSITGIRNDLLCVLADDVLSIEEKLFNIQMADDYEELIGVEDLIIDLCVKKSLVDKPGT